MLAGAALAAAFVVFGLVYLHVLSTEKQSTLDVLSQTQAKQQRQYEAWRVAVDRANSPARIMKEAIRLGMVQPAVENDLPAVSGSATPASQDTVPANGAQAPSGVSDWASTKRDLTGAS